MEKLFGKSWRTSIVGWLMVGYGLSDMALTRGITEFGFLALTMGTGFIKAMDDTKQRKDDSQT